MQIGNDMRTCQKHKQESLLEVIATGVLMLLVLGLIVTASWAFTV